MSDKKKTRSVGRPRLPKGHAKGKIVPVRVNADDLKVFTTAAKANKKSLSEWMRGALREAALTDAAFRIQALKK